MRIAIIGAGPAGFHLLDKLLKRLPTAQFSLFEKRQVPGGLIKFGVAPDHPEIKTLLKKFSELVQNNRVEFFGGIDVGLHISLNVIQTFFDITIIATGAYHPKYLNLPGFDGKNIFTSKDLVSSYNNDPIHSPIRLNLKSARKALIIGQGNVSLDIARILLKDPEELWKTDISLKFLKELVMSALRKIHIIGRRGPLEASFSAKEFRELQNLPIKLVFNKKDIAENMRIAETVKERRVVRIFQLFQSSINPSKTKDHSEKTCHIDFYHKPLKAILDKSGSVKSVLFDRGRRKLSQLATDLIITATGFSNDDRSPQSQLCHDNFKCFHIVGWAALGPRGTLAATFNQVDQVVEEIMGSAKSNSLPTKYSEDFNPLFALRVPFLNKTDLKIIVEQGIRMGNLLGRDFQYLSDLKVSRSWDLK